MIQHAPAGHTEVIPLGLQMREVTTRFPGVLANDRVNLSVAPGEIHGLMGENGAGKSTLMSVLYGMVQPESGEIEVGGELVQFRSPVDAISRGIGMVHQAFKLFNSLSVWENVVFRDEPGQGGFVSRSESIRQVRELSQTYGLAVDPTAKVQDLPVGVRQRVEILKALYRRARLLILDEPTAVLAPQEKDELFTVLRALRAEGHTIIIITHKLGEVMELTDSVTVLRDGRVVLEAATATSTAEELTRAMTGRDIAPVVRPGVGELGTRALDISNLTVTGQHGERLVDNATLNVRGGEIVGVAGVAGNGQSELVEAIVGLRQAAAGTVRIAGKDSTDLSVRRRRDAGLAYIPEDRSTVGSAPDASLAENVVMGHHRSAPISRHTWLSKTAIEAFANRIISEYSVRPKSSKARAGALSGGNLQKVIIGREVSFEGPLLIAEQPTRGVDIGAIEFIHGELLRLRSQGKAILLVSAELTEILALSDRILVMYEGRIVADMTADRATEREIGMYMAGMFDKEVATHES